MLRAAGLILKKTFETHGDLSVFIASEIKRISSRIQTQYSLLHDIDLTMQRVKPLTKTERELYIISIRILCDMLNDTEYFERLCTVKELVDALI